MKITGLVLCGGRSTRMGRDKGLLIKDTQPWARIMTDKITSLDMSCKISINKDQLNDYATIFDRSAMIVDHSNLSGPLRGILSAHEEFPESNWLILACDMVDMDPETLNGILKSTHEAPDKDFYVYRTDTYYEPFGGVYTARGLRKVYNMYSNNLSMNCSLQYVLNRYETHTLSSKHKAAFRNYNTL